MYKIEDIISNHDMNLHIKSTVGELPLFNVIMDGNTYVSEIMSIFKTNPSLPGIIATMDEKFAGFISRRKFFEQISKKYCLEIFSHRPLNFFLASLDNYKFITISSNLLVVDAVQLTLQRPKDIFHEPLLIEFESGDFRILDTYQLIIAHSYINTLAIKALNEASEFKTDMLNMAAHDLKNPLGTINNLSKMALSFLDNKDSDIFEMISQIKQLATHMQELVMELLNSTVIESGKMQLKKQIIDFSELVYAILYQAKPNAEAKNQSINTQFNGTEMVFVNGDMIKLREACENLVSNAIKYSPFKSSIEVSLKNLDDKVVFAVKDEGPGLDEDDMQKLFNKFQRLSAQPTNGESSTGLGLFIAKQIVDLHEGNIFVESQPGNGAKFIIELPVANIENC